MALPPGDKYRYPGGPRSVPSRQGPSVAPDSGAPPSADAKDTPDSLAMPPPPPPNKAMVQPTLFGGQRLTDDDLRKAKNRQKTSQQPANEKKKMKASGGGNTPKLSSAASSARSSFSSTGSSPMMGGAAAAGPSGGSSSGLAAPGRPTSPHLSGRQASSSERKGGVGKSQTSSSKAGAKAKGKGKGKGKAKVESSSESEESSDESEGEGGDGTGDGRKTDPAKFVALRKKHGWAQFVEEKKLDKVCKDLKNTTDVASYVQYKDCIAWATAVKGTERDERLLIIVDYFLGKSAPFKEYDDPWTFDNYLTRDALPTVDEAGVGKDVLTAHETCSDLTADMTRERVEQLATIELEKLLSVLDSFNNSPYRKGVVQPGLHFLFKPPFRNLFARFHISNLSSPNDDSCLRIYYHQLVDQPVPASLLRQGRCLIPAQKGTFHGSYHWFIRLLSPKQFALGVAVSRLSDRKKIKKVVSELRTGAEDQKKPSSRLSEVKRVAAELEQEVKKAEEGEYGGTSGAAMRGPRGGVPSRTKEEGCIDEFQNGGATLLHAALHDAASPPANLSSRTLCLATSIFPTSLRYPSRLRTTLLIASEQVEIFASALPRWSAHIPAFNLTSSPEDEEYLKSRLRGQERRHSVALNTDPAGRIVPTQEEYNEAKSAGISVAITAVNAVKAAKGEEIAPWLAGWWENATEEERKGRDKKKVDSRIKTPDFSEEGSKWLDELEGEGLKIGAHQFRGDTKATRLYLKSEWFLGHEYVEMHLDLPDNATVETAKDEFCFEFRSVVYDAFGAYVPGGGEVLVKIDESSGPKIVVGKKSLETESVLTVLEWVVRRRPYGPRQRSASDARRKEYNKRLNAKAAEKRARKADRGSSAIDDEELGAEDELGYEMLERA